jgi:hypothetical protein
VCSTRNPYVGERFHESVTVPEIGGIHQRSSYDEVGALGCQADSWITVPWEKPDQFGAVRYATTFPRDDSASSALVSFMRTGIGLAPSPAAP